jgi:DNA polymerase (family 10)
VTARKSSRKGGAAGDRAGRKVAKRPASASRKKKAAAPAAPVPEALAPPVALTAEQIAAILQEIAALLEITGENPFKVRAYENAARILPGVGDELVALVESGDLRKVRGIGSGIADRVAILARTGRLDDHEELRSRVPDGLLEMLRIPGLGPKKVKLLYDTLDIGTVAALETACREDQLKEVRGFGAKTQENILRGIAYLRRVSARFFWSVAAQHATPVYDSLAQHPAVIRAALAGSLRRRKETVHDVDIVVSTADPDAVTQHFASGVWVERVIGSGPTKTSILHPSGLQIDLRVVTDEQYPYALHHFTGSKAHNVAMRGRAVRMGIKINEYGLFRGDELIRCADEEAIFAALGLSYVPPELREDEGEIEAAESDSLPRRLLTLEDLRGTFHVHTQASDGRDSLEGAVRAARDRGWEYIGISDHSHSSGGMQRDAALAQIEEVARVARRLPGICILHGIEVEIRPDGSLDEPADMLRRFDFVIAAVHDHLELGRDEQTQRLLRALENPYVSILAHPTSRILFERPAIDVDLAAVFDAAARHGVAVEINGQPKRMDPDGALIRTARDRGALLCVNPDAHDVPGLAHVEYGVGLARRGWLEPHQVLNTRDAAGIDAYLVERRARAEAKSG